MRKRLAKKIKDHPKRYSRERYFQALIRLGWKLMQWRIEIPVEPRGE